MKTQLLNTANVKALVKSLKENDYDVETQANGDFKPAYVAYSGDRVIFRALPHSSGKNYLVQYDINVIRAAA